MTPDNYLELSIRLKLYKSFAWIVSAFTVTRETEVQRANVYPGKLIREPFGLFVIDEDGERVQLKTSKKPDEPLFTKNDAFTITPAVLPWVKEPTPTTIGRLLLNLIAVYEPFQGKLSYINKPFSPSDVEKLIAPVLKSNPSPGEKEDPAAIYVRDNLRYGEAVSFLETLSSVFAHSITRVGLLPAPGRKEFKKELLKKYEGKLTDPVEMSKFEKELEQFDNEYLKQDPAYGKFMKGKVKASRMKSFMTQGGETNDFTGSMEVTPIIPALEDGIPLDKNGFTAIANTIRYGSFSRGAETVNGGVVAKALMRAADNWRITPGDCGTKLGLRRTYREHNIARLVGRSIIQDGKVVKVDSLDQAKAYIGRKIVIRSPQYCRRSGTQTCEVCATEVLSKYPQGLTIPLSEVSGGVLSDSLKKMHNTALSTAVLQLSDAVT